MTFRLCLVGNSHLGAYRRAWRKLEGEFATTSISMYGAPGQLFGDLRVDNGEIVADSETAAVSLVNTGGHDRIRLADYDALVIIGGNARLNTLAAVLRAYRPPFMNLELGWSKDAVDRSFKRRLAGFYEKAQPVLASSALVEAILKSINQKSNAVRLLSSLAGYSDLALGHAATPFPSAAMLDVKPRHTLSRIVKLGVGDAFADMNSRALEGALPHRVVLVGPPQDVLVGGIFTDHIYSSGSLALHEEKGEHGEDDFVHMNELYGEIMLRRVVHRLRV